MTHQEFISKTHFMMDSYGVVPAGGIRMEDNQEGTRKRARSAAAFLKRVALDAQAARISGKLDRTAELMDRLIAKRNAPVASAENAGPSADDLAAQWAAAYAAQADRRCAEAKAAYDARNPHKRKEAAR